MDSEILKISSLTSKFESLLNGDLPGISAHKKMIPIFPGDAPDYFNFDKTLRDAAVLIILFEDKGRVKTVFIERMPDPGPHSGQIAFPGGRKEENDIDLSQTALREAEEEIGVKINREYCIGTLTPVQIPISGYSVTPVVCFIDFIPKFKICEIEVKNVFVADLLDVLASETTKDIIARGININAPSYLHEQNVIWGATAMVLRELKEILFEADYLIK